MNLHERDDLLRAARADWAADPTLREDYRQHRPNVDRTISPAATHGRQRIKLPYLGAQPSPMLSSRASADRTIRAGTRRIGFFSALLGWGGTRSAGRRD